jgi:hypothetical protein
MKVVHKLCSFWLRQDGKHIGISLRILSRRVEVKRNTTMHSSEDMNDRAEQSLA